VGEVTGGFGGFGGGARSPRLGLLLLLPAAVLIGALMLYPVAHMIGMATVENGRPVIGQWGRVMARDAVLWTALSNTLVFVLGSVTGEMVVGLAFALLLWQGRGRLANLARGLILLPSMLSPTVVGIVWLLLLYPFGLVNWGTTLLGLGRFQYLADPRLAMASIIFVDIWQWTPFVFIFTLAGLTALPAEPREAALVDGASAWQVFRHVTLPLLGPTLAAALMFRVIDAFRAFDKILIMTNGGPAEATSILSIYLYKVSFHYQSWSYGALLGLLLMGLTLAFHWAYSALVVRRLV